MSKIEIVSCAWLAAHLDDPDVVLLDGSSYLPTAKRDPQAEFLAAHIPGAQRFDIDAVSDKTNPLPHMLPSTTQFAEAAGRLGITEDDLVVVYDGAGIHSAPRVAWTFRTFGAKRVAVLDGGLPAWRAEGLPTETGDARARPAATFRAVFDAAAVASVEDVKAALAGGGIQVVDVRPPGRFRGEAPEPRAGLRAGHMPGAVNLHYEKVLASGRLAGTDTIATELAGAGIGPDRPVITSCGSGVSAVIMLLAMEQAGLPAPVIYDGSWSEWGARQDTEVVTGPA